METPIFVHEMSNWFVPLRTSVHMLKMYENILFKLTPQKIYITDKEQSYKYNIWYSKDHQNDID